MRLPPDFAAFSFRGDVAGTDAALAARTLAVAAGGRIGVIGAARWALLVALARDGAHVVALDPSRHALRVAADAAEMAGVAERLTLFAADPREFVFPGGVAAALVPAFAWRVLVAPESRAEMLHSIRRSLLPGGALCIDVDRLPRATPAETERTLLRHGPGRQEWWWRLDPARQLVTVSCEAPGAGPFDVELADVTPEGTVAEVRAAGFRVEASLDASTGGVATQESERLWIVARDSG